LAAKRYKPENLVGMYSQAED